MVRKQLAVIVITDGLRRDHIRADWTPVLHHLRTQSVWLSHHRSVLPSVTRVCSSSIATGSLPLHHELAGNKLCLEDQGRLRLFDVGKPEFFPMCRALRGYILRGPTWAERIRSLGPMRVYGNASPGAAYVQDPNHYGFVFHRAGSYSPQGKLAAPDGLTVSGDLAGDRSMTHQFLADLGHESAAVYLLWLGHPDTTQHHHPLGSPEHLQALRQTDQNVERVFSCVQELRRQGRDVLFLAGSDHGHETVTGLVNIQAELAQGGFADQLAKGDLIVAPNGTAALIYLKSDKHVRDRLYAFLQEASWIETILTKEQFARYGVCQAPWLEFFLSLRKCPHDVNAFGVSGTSLACLDPQHPDPIGCGQHGGMGIHEQMPYCLLNHPSLVARETNFPTDLTVLAPTVLTFFGLPCSGMDGFSIQHILSLSLSGDHHE